ncbi:putative holin-like toxin [Paenibacillus sp. FSL R10-2748]|uniref:putative holin-like toxin n=1 Tax=unclassified Paenibacillus TaxID=185978 RepID=UPI0020B69A59|nr:putative holin-like toxin [Paenibacillus sp. A3M_27_13]
MEVKDTLMLMIQFATLVILILSLHKKEIDRPRQRQAVYFNDHPLTRLPPLKAAVAKE